VPIIKNPKTREEVAANVRQFDDAGYARGTTERVLDRQINRFPFRRADRDAPVIRVRGRRQR
jgi:hypothetical protein